MNKGDAMANRHPPGLYTLFFAEMWERASYYGMRALLVLFLTASISEGGMGLNDKPAAAIYGIYTAAVYVASLPGGWIADRLLGMKNAVFYGGCIIAAGHFTLALPWNESFYTGLLLIVLGTGLLKPCISSLVGELYAHDTIARRDAAFSIYYMGINIGAIIGPLACGYLGEAINWHYGFAAAGVGMVLGLLHFRLSGTHLAAIGNVSIPASYTSYRRNCLFTGMAIAAACTFTMAAILGVIHIDPAAIAAMGSLFIAALAILYFGYIYLVGGISPIEKRRMQAAAVLFAAAALFWAGFEQAGSSFNLFAARYTDREIFGWEMPASWMQSVNPLLIILLAPFFAALWMRLGARNLDPSSPLKFAIALLLLGAGFGVMAMAAYFVVQGDKVLPLWLIMTYLLHTMGELCLSPIGLSLVTRLAPRGFTAQMMGLWFMSSAIGNLMAGLIAGKMGQEDIHQMPALFLQMLLACAIVALALFALRKPMRRWMENV